MRSEDDGGAYGAIPDLSMSDVLCFTFGAHSHHETIGGSYLVL